MSISFCATYCTLSNDYIRFIQTIQELLDDKEAFRAKYKAAAHETGNEIEQPATRMRSGMTADAQA